jgi:hypothetical protein
MCAQVLVLMVPYTTISDTDGAFALAFADVGMGWARYLVSAGAAHDACVRHRHLTNHKVKLMRLQAAQRYCLGCGPHLFVCARALSILSSCNAGSAPTPTCIWATHIRLIAHRLMQHQWLSCDAGALLGMVSSCYVALYGQARILCVVARDHMLPPVLARISPRLGTPAIAATVMGLATGLILSGAQEYKCCALKVHCLVRVLPDK